MKIAVAYENGMIFPHFGKTKTFKMYEAENGKIVSCDLLESQGEGHSALAEFLRAEGVDLVICGGMGEGAQTALTEAGIEICSGAEGDADEAVAAYLNGELHSTDANCEHHGEGHACGACGGSCGEEEESSCAGSCGSCGGCGSRQPAFDGPNVGKICRTHYRGTFNDGAQFDSSYDRGEPLEFVCGAGQMILGFDKAVATMEVGQKIQVHLMPEEAYGPKNPEAIIRLEIASLPGSENLSVGQQVYLTNQFGQQFPVTVTEKDETKITFDANHEMAGKELNFEIELVEVKDGSIG